MRNKAETSNLGPLKMKKVRRGKPREVVLLGHRVPQSLPVPSIQLLQNRLSISCRAEQS